tara:strand:- start:190 stop:1122 length:933 start_codon:yes stop_codon:yes gene_type:complete
MNFLYCLDENYNTQAIMSLYTLNKNIDTTINIFIAHNNVASIKKQISQFNLDKLNIKYLNISNNIELPNLKNEHVTEATYYRIFALSKLNESLDHIVYIDSDIIFNKNPLHSFNSLKNKLFSSEFEISANTIGKYQSGNKELDEYFDYLEINDKYFNAGVIMYDLNKYRKNKLDQKLKSHLINFNKEAKYWDQDILNVYFNGQYLELPETLNNNVVTENANINMEEELEKITLHFAGRTKPWHVEGFKYPVGCYFQKIYRSIFDDEYFISPYNKRRHFREIKNFLRDRKSYCINNQMTFLIKSTFLLFKL